MIRAPPNDSPRPASTSTRCSRDRPPLSGPHDHLDRSAGGGPTVTDPPTADELRREILDKTRQYYEAAFASPRAFRSGHFARALRWSRVRRARAGQPGRLLARLLADVRALLTRVRRRLWPRISACKHALLVNSGSIANLLAFAALTSDTPGRATHPARRRGHHRGRRLPHHRRAHRAVRRRARLRRRGARHVQHRRDPARGRAVAAHQGGHARAHAGQPVRHRRRSRVLRRTTCGSSRTTATRWAASTAAARPAPSATSARRASIPPHHMTMGEGGAVYTDDAELAAILLSMRDWGRDCWCPSGKDNTCGKRFDAAVRHAALRLRPQVRLLGVRLQPQGHRHAGGGGRGAAARSCRSSSRRAGATTPSCASTLRRSRTC